MNTLSYHLILIRSSLRLLTDQVDQLSKCIDPSFAETTAGLPSVLRRDPPSVPGCDMHANEIKSIVDSVYESIKRSRKGIAFVQIQKKTGFNRKQIANAIYKLKKRDLIKAKKRGVYIRNGTTLN